MQRVDEICCDRTTAHRTRAQWENVYSNRSVQETKTQSDKANIDKISQYKNHTVKNPHRIKSSYEYRAHVSKTSSILLKSFLCVLIILAVVREGFFLCTFLPA